MENVEVDSELHEVVDVVALEVVLLDVGLVITVVVEEDVGRAELVDVVIVGVV